MTLQDITNDWAGTSVSSQSSGTFSYGNGETVNYQYYAEQGHEISQLQHVEALNMAGNLFGIDNRNEATIVFDTDVRNVTFAFNSFNDGISGESVEFVIDGEVVDLRTLVQDGDATITGTFGTNGVAATDAAGQLSPAGSSPHEYFLVTFNNVVGKEYHVNYTYGNSLIMDIKLDDDPQYAPSTNLPCFTTGTLIDTDRGQVAVEDLKAGDKIRTLDHGFQPIRWVGHSRVHDAPIRIKAGTFNNTRDMVVSPRHRMLLQGWQVGLLFNHDEAFAAAYDMKNGDSIAQEPEGWVDYYHILLPHHEVIFAESTATESFYPDEASLNSMAKAAREELQQHFNPETYGPTARPTLTANQAMYVGHNLDVLEDEPQAVQIQAAE